MVRIMAPAPPRRVHVWLAKIMGATMWCWILWRLKHDWRDVFVSASFNVTSWSQARLEFLRLGSKLRYHNTSLG